MAHTPELSPALFVILSALVEEKLGLHYSVLDRDLFQDKVATRALEAGFDSLLDYYYFLRYDPGSEDELRALTDALVVGETYFFREHPPLRMLLDTFLVPWCKAGRRPRVWSAACATGEEPLSLAMMLADLGLADAVEIVATDISQRALDRARAGVYGGRALRANPEPRLVERYLTATPQGYRIAPALVAGISWRQVNLVDDAAVAALGVFDVILCRNVLIYFRDETIRTVVERLSNRLAPDGVLLVGVAESLLRFGTTLVGEERDGSFVYRKEVRS